MNENNLKQNLAEINRLQAQIKREKIKQRKLRTRRLIQKGALLEAYFDMRDSSIEETEKILSIIAPEVKKIRDEDF